MEQVDDKFYNWYNRLVTAFGGVLFVAVTVVWLLPVFEDLRIKLGLTLLTGIIGLVQLLYGLFLYPRRAKANPYMAALLSTMLILLNTINIIHNTGQFHSQFIWLWVVFAFFSGLFGLYSVITYSFIITIYFVMSWTGPTATFEGFDRMSLMGVLGTYFICLVSYNFWKHFYINQESKQVKQLSGALSNSQAQSTILIKSITDGIIVTDSVNKINLLNPSAAKMTGWAGNEAQGIDANLVLKLQQENGMELPVADNPFRQTEDSLEPINTILRLVSKDNSFLIVSISVSPILDDAGKTKLGNVAVLRDVSDARAEENRRADFISTASHEMRTPVAAIEGYLALALNDKVSKIDTKARNFLEKAHESTQRLGKLFQDLLTSAKAEDGRLVNHPVVVEIGGYLEILSEGLKFSAEKKGLQMEFVIGGSATQDATNVTGGGKVVKPLYFALIDPDRMREVITNIFDNAVKYTDTGKISFGLTGSADVIQFFIRDTGHGIPPEDVPHLFQKFYRVDNSSTRTVGGTGLGLFICQKIIEMYHGRIWVESEVNKGSTFYVNLPRLSTQKAAELQAKQAQQTT